MSSAEMPSILRLLGWFARRNAIRRYVRDAPRKLLRDYGHAGPFTPEQVLRGLERHSLPTRHRAYALAIFCDPKELARRRDSGQFTDDFPRLRAEVGKVYFGGDVAFNPLHLIGAGGGSDDGSGHGGWDHGHGGFDGGGHGGDGGGH